jgi:hypothetical protein
MPEVQSVVSYFWWLPFVTLLFAAGCITAGLGHAYRAVWLWRHRDRPISDPVIAKALEGVKPPPYTVYAALWLAAGMALAGVTIKLWA